MHMAKSPSPRFGVDPVISFRGRVDPPFCPHGPTLLFKRYYSDREPRQFYACAVHRDRKGCSFFHWEDEKIDIEKRDRWKKAFLEQQPTLESTKLLKNLEIIKSLNASDRQYCPHCGLLLVEKDLSSHTGHGVIQGIADTQIEEPTTLLTPVDDRKSKAQFFFSDDSLHLFHDELKRLQYTKVLCIGTPRVHELLMKEGKIQSLLLDIDHRYIQFYTSQQCQRYNMFNHYFYAPDGLKACQDFITEASSTTAIVVDPPFGGLAELLAVSIRKLWEMASKELTTFLVFPYYLESHVTSALPSLWMTDYQVTYLNHKHFGATQKKPKPSPVRIFTNLSLPGFRLPAKEGYHMCKTCNRYIAKFNSHCEKCGTCTSKDGRPYVHCDTCERCVKQSWVHCEVCNKCDVLQHRCGAKSIVGCHVCGSLEHKRKDCSKAKRKSELRSPPPRKRRKRFNLACKNSSAKN